MKIRPDYVITSEKAKDLANDNEIARIIIKQAQKAERENIDRVNSDLERITKDIENLMGELKTLKKSVTEYSKTVPDAVFEEQKKFRIMARKVQTLIERNIVEEINSEGECIACGHTLEDREDRWQFCPVCGQRFKDNWILLKD